MSGETQHSAGEVSTKPPLPLAGGAQSGSPLPLAGGVGGGQFKPRDTKRARDLRNQATPAERLLWSVLGSRRLNGYKFSRQIPVGPYFADFLCRATKLVIEIDGYSHDLRLDHDQRRDAFMAAQGLTVLRFTNDEVLNNLEGVASSIGKALAERCPPPTPPASGRGAGRAAQTCHKPIWDCED